MIGAIVLTHRRRPGVRQEPEASPSQVARRRRGNGGGQKSAVAEAGPEGDGNRTRTLPEHSPRSCSRSVIFGIFINRKNVIIILMSIELMLLAVNINLVAFSVEAGRSGRTGFRHLRADRGSRRGGHRVGHPGRLFPQPRFDRGRGHQHDERVSRPQWKPPSYSSRCWAPSSPASSAVVIKDSGAMVGVLRAAMVHVRDLCRVRPVRATSRSPMGDSPRMTAEVVLSSRGSHSGYAGIQLGLSLRHLRSAVIGRGGVRGELHLVSSSIIYSIGYMAHDPHRARFFAYLSFCSPSSC